MKKILIQSGLSPFEAPTYDRILSENLLGGNLGNLLYATSVYKTLYTREDVSFRRIYSPFKLTQKYIDEVNETCRLFVLPLANALRPDFMPDLEVFTQLIKGLKIPCVVIGMGVNAPYEPGKDFHFPFDGKVKAFISAVLDKSACVGVRGHITADYLRRLGFRGEGQIEAIGCPSMYFRGGVRTVKDIELSEDSVVTYNTAPLDVPELTHYLHRQAGKFKRHWFIPQNVKELKYLYLGRGLKTPLEKAFQREMYLDGSCLFFNNVRSWLDFLDGADFTFGTRMHGCFASVLESNPVLFIPRDARERELSEYHRIPSIPLCRLDMEKDVFELAQQVDFKSPIAVHPENFSRYIAFLEKNGIENVWSKPELNLANLFDERFAKVEPSEPARACTQISKMQLLGRLVAAMRLA